MADDDDILNLPIDSVPMDHLLARVTTPADPPMARKRLSRAEVNAALAYLQTTVARIAAERPGQSVWWTVSDAIDACYNRGEIRSVAVGAALDRIFSWLETTGYHGSFSQWCGEMKRLETVRNMLTAAIEHSPQAHEVAEREVDE